MSLKSRLRVLAVCLALQMGVNCGVCRREALSLHAGMNCGVGGSHSLILMSVRRNAPYDVNQVCALSCIGLLQNDPAPAKYGSELLRVLANVVEQTMTFLRTSDT